jgi:hypothetical protein
MADHPTPQHEAVEHLRLTAQLLQQAAAAAEIAESGLTYGGRICRCRELRAKIADAWSYANRLSVVVTGDLRSDEA